MGKMRDLSQLTFKPIRGEYEEMRAQMTEGRAALMLSRAHVGTQRGDLGCYETV